MKKNSIRAKLMVILAIMFKNQLMSYLLNIKLNMLLLNYNWDNFPPTEFN